MSWELPPPPPVLHRCDAISPAEDVVYFILHGDVYEKDYDKIFNSIHIGIVNYVNSWRHRIQQYTESRDLTPEQQQRLDNVNRYYEKYHTFNAFKSKRKSKKSVKSVKKKKKSAKKSVKNVKRKKKSAKKY